MFAAFQTTAPIPEYRAEAGYYLIFNPGNPFGTVAVMYPIPDAYLSVLLRHWEKLRLVAMSPPVQRDDPAQLLLELCNGAPDPPPDPVLPGPEPWPGPPLD